MSKLSTSVTHRLQFKALGQRVRHLIRAGLVAAVVGVAGASAEAQQVTWLTSAGTWSTGSNWSSGSVPSAGSAVYFGSTFPVGTRTVTYDSVQPTISYLSINTGAVDKIANLAVSSTLSIATGSNVGLSFNYGAMTINSGGAVLLTGSASGNGKIGISQAGSFLTINGGLLSQAGSGGMSFSLQDGPSLTINSGTLLRSSGSTAAASLTVGRTSTMTLNGGRYEADSRISLGNSNTGGQTSRLTVNGGELVLTTGSNAGALQQVFNIGESGSTNNGTYIATIGGTAGSPFVSVSNPSNNAMLTVGNRGGFAVGSSQLQLLSGTLRVNGVQLFTSSTVTFSGGELATRTITTATNTVVFNFSGGTLRPWGANATIGSTTSGSNFTITLTSTGATLSGLDATGGTARTLTMHTPLVDGTSAGGLTVAGGTVSLSAANTYTGTTSINAGTLALATNGSFANSPRIVVGNAGSSGVVLDLTSKTGGFTFGSGQTVGGIGTINIGAGQTVTSQGIWAPGNSIGSNAVTGNLTVSGTSQFELGTPGPSATSPGNADFTAVSGTLTLGGNLALINNANADSLGSYGAGSYRLFTAPTVSGTFASVTAPAGATTTRVGMVYTSGTASGQGVFANVYNLASAAATQTVNLGNARIGTGTTAAVTLANLSPLSVSYTETLSTGNFSSTTTGFTTSGSASNITGGGSGSGNLLVGLGAGLAAGAQSGTTTLALFSNAVNSSGLAQQSIGSQTITITGTMFNPASANSLPATVTLGNIRVGSAFGTQSLSIWNTGSAATAFQEGLNASIASTAGSASGSGSITNLYMAGGTSTALSVGLGAGNQGTAGAVSGTATIGFATNGTLSSLSNASLSSQDVAVSGTAYDFARAVYTGGTYAFGNVRTGSAATAQNVAFGNSTITNASFQDSLNVSGSTTNSAVTATGFTGLAASTGGATTQNLSLSATTATAGSLASTVNLTLVSNANGVSGLSNGTATVVGSPAAITTTGGVYDFAQAKFSGATLNFGVVHRGASVSSQSVTFGNQTVTSASYQDSLDVSATTGNARVNASGFTGLAASSGGATTNNLTVSVNTSTAGSLASTLSLTLTSNANGVAGLSNGTAATVGGGSITTTGGVFSGTGSWNQATGGSWGTGANANWTSVESVSAAPGTFAGYADTDSAILGGAVASGTALIKLDGAQVSLASIKFDNATARYVIDSGTGSGSFTLAAAAGKPVVDVVGIHEIAAAINGTNGLEKTGLGKLILSGSNNYSGGTDISAGTLAVNGFLGGAVNVANDAILGGSGSINGLVTVAAGGILAPGNSPGTLTMNSGLVLDAASILNFELSSTNFTAGGGFNDLIVVTGNFTLDGILNVSGLGDFSTVADNTKWRLFNYSGGTFTNGGLSLGSMPSVGTSGKTFQIDTSTAGQVNLVIVPEPGALALAGLGIAAAAYTLRSRSPSRKRAG